MSIDDLYRFATGPADQGASDGPCLHPDLLCFDNGTRCMSCGRVTVYRNFIEGMDPAYAEWIAGHSGPVFCSIEDTRPWYVRLQEWFLRHCP